MSASKADDPTLGILGAGKLGTVLARLAVAAGYRTLIAASGDPQQIDLILRVLAPGALARRASDVARDADVVVLAIPLSKRGMLPADALADKIVIDAMNYWPPSDGVIPEFENGGASSSIVARTLPGARVVKALSHLGYHELDSDGRSPGSPDRRAIAIAGDDPDAVSVVASLVDRLGFDPVVAGPLAAGTRFGPGTSLFGVSVDRNEVARRLGLTLS